MASRADTCTQKHGENGRHGMVVVEIVVEGQLDKVVDEFIQIIDYEK